MPLLLTVSCFSKIQIGFILLVPAHMGSPGKRAVKRVCVTCRMTAKNRDQIRKFTLRNRVWATFTFFLHKAMRRLPYLNEFFFGGGGASLLLSLGASNPGYTSGCSGAIMNVYDYTILYL